MGITNTQPEVLYDIQYCVEILDGETKISHEISDSVVSGTKKLCGAMPVVIIPVYIVLRGKGFRLIFFSASVPVSHMCFVVPVSQIGISKICNTTLQVPRPVVSLQYRRLRFAGVGARRRVMHPHYTSPSSVPCATEELHHGAATPLAFPVPLVFPRRASSSLSGRRIL